MDIMKFVVRGRGRPFKPTGGGAGGRGGGRREGEETKEEREEIGMRKRGLQREKRKRR